MTSGTTLKQSKAAQRDPTDNSLSVASSGDLSQRSRLTSSSIKGFVNATHDDIAKAAALRAASKEDTSLASASGTISFKGLAARGEGALAGEAAVQAEMAREKISKKMKQAVNVVEAKGRASVMRRHLLAAVAEDDSQRKTCVKLPLTLIYAAVYILFYQLHYNTAALYVQDASIRRNLGPEPAQAETAEDIYRWMEDRLFPFLWRSGPGVAPAENKAPQRLLGGVRISTARGPLEADCDARIFAGGLPCTPGESTGGLPDATGISDWRSGRRLSRRSGSAPRRLLEGAPARRAAGKNARARRLEQMNYAWMNAPVDVGAPGAYKVVPVSMDPADVGSMINGFRNESSQLIDSTTLYLTAEFATLNEEISGGIFSVTTVTFMFSRGGGIYQLTSVNSLASSLKSRAIGVLVVWLVLLLYLTVTYVTAAVVAAKSHAFRVTFFNFASFIDLVMIAGGWFLVVFIAMEAIGMSEFNTEWDAYMAERATADAASLQDLDVRWMEEIFSSTSAARTIAMDSITIVAAYMLLLFVRFLITTMGHPRLALVVRTLMGGMSDLVHLLFIFMVVFIAYVMSGVVLFGRRMEEFSTFGGSFGYCLQIVFQRQFDYDDLTQEDMFLGALWVVSFVLVLVLVGVNLVLTMIFNNYGEVRETLDKNDNIYQFGLHLVRQLRNSSAWMSNSQVLGGLVQLPAGQSVTEAQVRAVVPGISQDQFEEIWRRAKVIARTAEAKTLKTSLSSFIASVFLEVVGLQRAVHSMAKARPAAWAEGPAEPGAVVKLAETGESHEPVWFDEAPIFALPELEPTWVKGSLARHLKVQQELMAAMSQQLEMSRAQMAKRISAPPAPPWAPPAPGATDLDDEKRPTTSGGGPIAARAPRSTAQRRFRAVDVDV